LVKKMIISIKDHDNELNNEGVLEKYAEPQESEDDKA